MYFFLPFCDISAIFLWKIAYTPKSNKLGEIKMGHSSTQGHTTAPASDLESKKDFCIIL